MKWRNLPVFYFYLKEQFVVCLNRVFNMSEIGLSYDDCEVWNTYVIEAEWELNIKVSVGSAQ